MGLSFCIITVNNFHYTNHFQMCSQDVGEMSNRMKYQIGLFDEPFSEF